MDITTTVALVAGVILGAAGGYAVAVLITRAGQQTEAARGDADGARQEAYVAQARTEAAQARSETAQVRAESAQSRTDVAEARALAAAAQAEAAEVSAAVARAEAERDAAVEHARALAADREQMLAQFKVMSTETIDRQSVAADAQADARLKATEQLLGPVKDSLHRFHDRLTEVEKERVAIAADLRSQVQTVQQTGEQLRRETTALITALRKPQVRGAWGELQLQRVVELAGMVEHCDFVLQHTDTADDRVIRPDMRVDLAEGKFVFVDAKVPLSAFLDAQETDDPRDPGGGDDPVRAERPHPRRPARRQALLAVGAGHAGVRRAVHAQRGAGRRGVRDPAGPPRVRLPPRRGAGHPDHADRAAPCGGVRLEAGHAGRERRRGAAARPRAARAAGHPRQPVRQARSRGPRLGHRLQRDRSPPWRDGCWSRRGSSPT